ncbi:MAG: hypothetical protein CL878_12590 [Dehalococcoidia bacterium]|nr:hypothetical protein [Dehalococcoidia bacterium]
MAIASLAIHEAADARPPLAVDLQLTDEALAALAEALERVGVSVDLPSSGRPQLLPASGRRPTAGMRDRGGVDAGRKLMQPRLGSPPAMLLGAARAGVASPVRATEEVHSSVSPVSSAAVRVSAAEAEAVLRLLRKGTDLLVRERAMYQTVAEIFDDEELRRESLYLRLRENYERALAALIEESVWQQGAALPSVVER